MLHLLKYLRWRNRRAQKSKVRANCHARFSPSKWRNYIYQATHRFIIDCTQLLQQRKKCFAAKSFCTWSSTFSQSLMVSVSKSKSVYASLIIVLAKSTWQQLIRAVSCHTQNLLRVLHLSAGQCPGAHNAWDNHFFAVTSPNVDRFSKFVTGRLSSKFAEKASSKSPPCLKFVATLSCSVISVRKLPTIWKKQLRKLRVDFHEICTKQSLLNFWKVKFTVRVSWPGADHYRQWRFHCDMIKMCALPNALQFSLVSSHIFQSFVWHTSFWTT